MPPLKRQRTRLLKPPTGLAVLVCVFIIVSMRPAWAQLDQAWVARFTNAQAKAIKVDSAGNVYIAGHLPGSGNNISDYAAAKYDSMGNQLWMARYDGPGNSTDYDGAMAIDTAGNAYATGSSTGAGSGLDYATVKYDACGRQLWVARYNGLANTNDSATAVAIDHVGNVYVTGFSRGVTTHVDYATVKYDPAGRQLWAARYDGPANSNDVAVSQALDHTGNIYVSGYSHGGKTGLDYTTVKYDANGNQLWEARYNGAANGDDSVKALALDDAGNVFVTGCSYRPELGFDYATVKYSPQGTQLWVARHKAQPRESLVALTIDKTGHVYITGSTLGTDDLPDYLTIKYDPDGKEVWTARYSAEGADIDYATAIAMDCRGDVYVTGTSFAGDTGMDYVTIKYGSDGTRLWVARYDGGNLFQMKDTPVAIEFDLRGDVYVAGQSGGDAATVKYSLMPRPSIVTPHPASHPLLQPIKAPCLGNSRQPSHFLRCAYIQNEKRPLHGMMRGLLCPIPTRGDGGRGYRRGNAGQLNQLIKSSRGH